MLALAFLVLPAAAAQASSVCPPGQPSQYPLAQCQLQLSQSTVAAGGAITVAGSGYNPNSAVSIDLSSTPTHLSSVTTDGSGAFSAVVTIPLSTPPGIHELTATGQDPGGVRVLSASITVTAPAGSAAPGPGASSGLAHTGAVVIPLALVALALIAGGLVLVRSARRRRSAGS
jgi:hypothetical protein